MKTTELEKRMRAGECFHNLRLLPAASIVQRLDGHGAYAERRIHRIHDLHDRSV